MFLMKHSAIARNIVPHERIGANRAIINSSRRLYWQRLKENLRCDL